MIHKIACISDIHFGASTIYTHRLYDNLHKYFLDKLKELQPDIIVIAGDYYHFKLAMTATEAQLGDNFMRELYATFPNSYILVIKGTEYHDRNQLGMFKSLENSKFRIYEKCTVDMIDDLKLLFIPEEYLPSKDSYKEVLNPVEKYDWVFFHGMFAHAGAYAKSTASHKFNKICFSTTDFANNVYGRVTGGHIHDPLTKDNVDYCGSFDRWVFGEDLVKGFRYYEYDSVAKKVLKNEFIPNEGAVSFVTKSYKEFNCANMDELVKQIAEESSKYDNFRIKIGRDDTVSDVEVQNLVAASLQFNNVTLLKVSPPITNTVTPEDIKESEERKKRMSEFEGLTFNQITKKFVKENLNASITDEQIADVLLND